MPSAVCQLHTPVHNCAQLHTTARNRTQLHTTVHNVMLSTAPFVDRPAPRAVDYESQKAYKTMMAIVQAVVSFVLVRPLIRPLTRRTARRIKSRSRRRARPRSPSCGRAKLQRASRLQRRPGALFSSAGDIATDRYIASLATGELGAGWRVHSRRPGALVPSGGGVPGLSFRLYLTRNPLHNACRVAY